MKASICFLDFYSNSTYSVSLIYTHKIRLYPTKAQQILLHKHFGARKWVYNNLLAFRKQEYLENKKGMSFPAMCAWIKMRKDTDMWWLKETNAQSLQQAAKYLDGAYGNFFKRNADFPNFVSKFDKQSFRMPQGVKIRERKIYLPKFQEGIIFRDNRENYGDIRSCTVSKTQSGEYYASFFIEKDIDPLDKTGNAVGIDIGIKTLAVCSDGMYLFNPKNTAKYAYRLKILQRRLSKKVKGSNNRNKARVKVAKLHEKIARKRVDTIHKFTKKVIERNDVIVIENLNTKGIVKNRKLSKSVSDAGFGEIKRQLEYKAEWYGKEVVKVGRWFPSSKTCSNCGYIKGSLTLSERVFKCTQCAMELDRDVNAGLNILREGLNLLPMDSRCKLAKLPTMDDPVEIQLKSSGTVKQEEPHDL